MYQGWQEEDIHRQNLRQAKVLHYIDRISHAVCAMMHHAVSAQGV